MRTRTTGARGSALLVVLWVIALLSFLVTTSMMVVMQDVETVAARRLTFRARQLAEAGLAIGANPAVKAGDPVLRKAVSPVESYEVNISTEEARINIGALLTEERRGVLERLFRAWGLRPVEAESVVDCLMDWVDQDDFKRLKGAERADYRKDGFDDRPYNRPFQSLDEVTMVRGMDLVAQANPGWRDAFTLWGPGTLDINEAPAELIALVSDASPSAARTLVNLRNGPDGLLHTEDDEPIKSVEEALVLLGVNAASPTQAVGAKLLALQGTVSRIESIGRAGTCSRRISVIMQKTAGGASPILEWRESTGD